VSVDKILSQVLGSGAGAGFAGGLAGGLASGMLTSKKGRKMGKKALQVGGLAALGGVAYMAFNRYKQNQTQPGSAPAPAPASTPPAPETVPASFVPPSPESPEAEALGLTLLRAMIAAAQADGRLDGDERRAIFERVESLDLAPPDKAELFAQLERPVDMGTLADAATTPEIAAEIYTASVLAIDVDTAAERGYLTMLAARLELPDALVEAIHQEVEAAAEPA